MNLGILILKILIEWRTTHHCKLKYSKRENSNHIKDILHLRCKMKNDALSEESKIICPPKSRNFINYREI